MAGSVDAAELLNLLESTEPDVVSEIKTLILGNLQSSKEAWLLNALIDSFAVSHSEKCLEILASVSEPHDKHLFDKLLEYIKGNSKLQALTILGYIVRKQPPWLHKIVHHSILTAVIKCLKTGTDVPILMSGVLLITSLLPLIPISVSGYLPDIFEVFSRLSAFNFKKPGNVPDVYLIHLQVGIYSLFHRLYGMYPCHFLTYLRSTYSRKENAQVFEKNIKPMLQNVRMHPLLVTASKEKEISRDRWKQLEVHDIIVDCAKLSLDLTEGTSEERKCPITDSKPRSIKLSNVTHTVQETTSVTVTKSTVVSSTRGITNGHGPALSHINTEGSFASATVTAPWSPGSSCGLSTPPPVPVTSNLKLEIPATSQASGQSSQPGQIGQTPQRMTPHTRVPDSPLPTQVLESHTDKSSSERHAKLQKRLSGFSLSLAGKLPTPTEGDTGSVPPSPLKPDFTSEPPLNLPKMQAIRKLSFQALEDRISREEEEGLPEPPCRIKKLLDPPKGKRTEHESAKNTSSGATASGKPIVTTAETTKGAEKLNAPSVTQLSGLIDNLVQDTEMIDDEVSALTAECELHGDTSSEGSDTPTHLPQSTDLTAQSVANFMKNVNRIRFNSINVVKNTRSVEKPAKSTRSRSCPSLENELSETEDSPYRERSDSMRSGGRTDVQSDTMLQTGVSNAATSPGSAPVATASSVEVSSTGSQTSFYLATAVDEEVECDQMVDSRVAFPYEPMFAMSVPFAPFIQCFYCMMKHKESSRKAHGGQSNDHKSVLGEKYTPYFSGYSPPDFLDRHIAGGMLVHTKELGQLPLTSQGAVAATHFGGASKAGSGVAPADELTVLRGQIVMLHNQLMFERHRREIHAKRNRRLLGSIAKHVSLEEQNNAMKDQLRLQENEIQSLKACLLEQQKKFHELKAAENTSKYEQEIQLRTCRQDLGKLQQCKKELTEKNEEHKLVNEELASELQSAKVRMFQLESDTQALRIKSEFSGGLQQQVSRLNKELLLMGELQLKYQQRLTSSGMNPSGKPDLQFKLDSYKMEVQNVKQGLETKTTQLDGTMARISELEEMVKEKDILVCEQKKRLEDAKHQFKCQLKAIEDKYAAEKKVQLSLQAQMLDLYNQIGRKSTPTKPAESPAPAAQPVHVVEPPRSQPLTAARQTSIPPIDSALDIAAMTADSDSSDPLRTPESEGGVSIS